MRLAVQFDEICVFILSTKFVGILFMRRRKELVVCSVIGVSRYEILENETFADFIFWYIIIIFQSLSINVTFHLFTHTHTHTHKKLHICIYKK